MEPITNYYLFRCDACKCSRILEFLNNSTLGTKLAEHIKVTDFLDFHKACGGNMTISIKEYKHPKITFD